MRILITGGAGVIAPYLIMALKGQGHTVLPFDVLDNDSYYVDIRRQEEVKAMFEVANPDKVYHLAASVGRENSEHKPNVLNVNVTGTYNVAKACADKDIELVSFSTSEVYGNHDGTVVDEHAYCEPINLYGVSKLAGEQVVNYFVRTYGLKAMIVRPFMIYGGEYDSDMRSALSRFFYAMEHGRRITVYADCVRAWCYVDDLVRGVTGKFIEGTFNIGNDAEPLTMKELYFKQVGIAGKSTNANFLYNNPNRITVPNKLASFDKAQQLLDYEPTVSLDEGLLETWKEMER